MPTSLEAERFGWVVPTGLDYAARPVADAFNWADCPVETPAGEWYLVAFRSIQQPTADQARLIEYDHLAHLEASGSPGFVHYFKGPLDPERACLSFCIWASRSDARRAAGKPSHREAVTLVRDMYESYTLEFVRLTRRPGEQGVRLEPYDRIAAA
jgi:hypothetical protein